MGPDPKNSGPMGPGPGTQTWTQNPLFSGSNCLRSRKTNAHASKKLT